MKVAVFALLAATASAYSFGVRPAQKMTMKMDMGKAAKAGAVAAALTVAGIATPAFAGDVAAGEQVFNANCAACHAGGQNVIMPDKTLEKEALEQYLAGGFKESSVVTQVTNGKNAMPAFGGRLDDSDIANVASYVISSADAGWDE